MGHLLARTAHRSLSYIQSQSTTSQVDRAPRHDTPRGDRSQGGSGVVARTYERPRGRSLPKWGRGGDTNVSGRPPPPLPPLAAAASKWGLIDSGLAQQVYVYTLRCTPDPPPRPDGYCISLPATFFTGTSKEERECIDRGRDVCRGELSLINISVALLLHPLFGQKHRARELVPWGWR